MSRIVTLTTDFGLSDHYAGSMKGVILSRCPAAQVIDICHEVASFSIWEGAYTIAQAAPFYPPGTIHVVVIDPGVGTERKAILAERGAQIFIAPDNGVLTYILPGASVRVLSNRDLFLPEVSNTFHGRDIFAAVAGALAAGAPIESVGPVLENPILFDNQPRVLSVDHFGNVITNIPASDMGNVAIETPHGSLTKSAATFGQAPPGELFLYAGSSGYVEIAINQGNAAETLRLRPGDLVRFAK